MTFSNVYIMHIMYVMQKKAEAEAERNAQLEKLQQEEKESSQRLEDVLDPDEYDDDGGLETEI